MEEKEYLNNKNKFNKKNIILFSFIFLSIIMTILYVNKFITYNKLNIEYQDSIKQRETLIQDKKETDRQLEIKTNENKFNIKRVEEIKMSLQKIKDKNEEEKKILLKKDQEFIKLFQYISKYNIAVKNKNTIDKINYKSLIRKQIKKINEIYQIDLSRYIKL